MSKRYYQTICFLEKKKKKNGPKTGDIQFAIHKEIHIPAALNDLNKSSTRLYRQQWRTEKLLVNKKNATDCYKLP